MEKQKQLEEYMAQVMIENNQVQKDTVNGMMKSEFVSCSYEEKALSLKFPVQPWQANRVGAFHGGTISLMFDITMAALARFFSRTSFAPTISLDVKYVRPAAIGENIIVTAKATATGQRISQFTAEAREEKTGKTIATGASVFLNVDTSK